MARLNEPPQPSVESIDALKRRFVRQNREIARANSTQSLRIRNLESEVSRLLSENVSLREQVIKLHYEVEKSTSKSLREGMDSVKSKLEAKLTELGGLIRELGEVQNGAENQRPAKRKSLSRSSPERSPDQKNWKNVLTLSEVTGGADGRLPPIVEGKYFPRRTMDAEELLEIFADPANIADSPELGPPPVAHFEEGDPIKFDPDHETQMNQASPESAEQHLPLSANLETRKKRRESSHHRDVAQKKSSVEPVQRAPSKDILPAMGQPLKSGAKRKLNVRELEEQPSRGDDQEKEEFQFERKTGDSRATENSATKPSNTRTSKPMSDRLSRTTSSGTHAFKEKPIGVGTSAPTTNRKALGPKSVNTDPVHSPVKANRVDTKNKIAEAKDDFAKIVRESSRAKDKPPSKRPAPTKDPEAAIPTTTVVKPIEPSPEMPAPPPSDTFSPVTSEASAARPNSRDTPPPADLEPDTGTGSFGRASRRQRGSVSYVQPNLRDKMRRPTKDLVDAVGAEERERQAKAEEETLTSAVIKQEEDADTLPIWRTNPPKESQSIREEATSPLSNRSSVLASNLPASVITERRRRITAMYHQENENDPEKQASGAGLAIAALVAGSQKSKRREEEKPSHEIEKREEPQELRERTSIYDFTGSSPPDPGGTVKETEISTNTTRASRRHSSVPRTTDIGKGSVTITRRGDRRRENVLGRGGEDQKDIGERPEMKNVKNVVDVQATAEAVALGRGERAATRRRSMML